VVGSVEPPRAVPEVRRLVSETSADGQLLARAAVVKAAVAEGLGHRPREKMMLTASRRAGTRLSLNISQTARSDFPPTRRLSPRPLSLNKGPPLGLTLFINATVARFQRVSPFSRIRQLYSRLFCCKADKRNFRANRKRSEAWYSPKTDPSAACKCQGCADQVCTRGTRSHG
jgi:hypothetical protein